MWVVADYRLLIIRYHLDMTAELKPYPTMKDSGVEWLGMIPEHWEIRRAKYLFNSIDVRSENGDEELLTVSSRDGVVPRSEKTVTMFQAASYAGHKLCWPGDLVINSLWAWANGLGFSRYHGIVSTAYGVYRLRPECNASYEYFNLALRSGTYDWEFQTRSKGIWKSRLQLTDWSFLDMPLIIPPLPEQVAIARYLNYVDARVRRLTEAKRKLIGLLTEYKQAIVHRAVTRGLDPNVPLKDSGIEWLGMVPQHWEIKPGRTCYLEKKQPNTGLVENTVLSLSYGKIVVKPKEKLHGLVPLSFETYQIIEPGDIICRPTDLQNDYNSLRFGLSSHRGIITSAYMCFDTQEHLDNRYGYLIFHTYDLLKVFYGLGSGLRQNLSWDDFKYLPCIIPPISEQVAIAEYLDRATAEIDIAVARAERQIELLNEYRARLIADVVTGKLDVRGATLDPEERDR